MTPRLSLSRRADRFAALLLGASALALSAAAFLPVAPGPSPAVSRAGVGLPTPPGGALAGGYRRASPFDPQRRPVEEGAVLSAGPAPAPVAEPVAVSEAPARIAGILVSGAARKVMFEGGGVWQGVGSAVGSWTVAAIEPRRVTLRRGGAVLVLRPEEALRPLP